MTVTHPAWRVLGASVAGSSHRATGRGCDDAHGWRLLDGAGSAAHAAEGAEAAVSAALDSLSFALLRGGQPEDEGSRECLMRDMVEEARAALRDLAEANLPPRPPSLREKGEVFVHGDSPPRVGEGPGGGCDRAMQPCPQAASLQDFATTLLVAVVTDGWIAAAHIGDGAIVVDSKTGMHALTLPDHGEYLNETVFLTSSDYRERARVVVLPRHGTRGVALLTDGLEALALNMAGGAPHSPFFTPLFGFAAEPDAGEGELASFLESARVCARTDDDKTLLLAVLP
jgi:hypothetical protein